MTKTYFENLQDIVLSHLNNAQKSVKVAVAWVNFPLYETVFMSLRNRGIKVKVIVNDDVRNRRYQESIQRLETQGIKIKFLRSAGLMHHKFCIIDKRRVLLGSFNWTLSADQRHYEDLTITDEAAAVNPCLEEFKALWTLSEQDLRGLKSPIRCEGCGEPIVNILLMEEDGPYNTKVDVLRACACRQEIVDTDYYDISLFQNYLGALDDFQDRQWRAEARKDMLRLRQIAEERDYFLATYFSSFTRTSRLGCPIIHAVGVRAQRWITKEDEEFYYKILWKERNTASYIEDEYEEL